MAVIDPPELPPLIFKRNGKYTYVCTYKNQWSSELKRAIRLKGVGKTVGKIVDGSLEGPIEWSKEFLKEHPILAKLKTERIKDEKQRNTKQAKYSLKFSPAPTEEEEEEEEDLEFLHVRKVSEVKQVNAGATWLLDNVIANTPLAKALARTFNSHYRSQKLLSLSYFKAIEPDSAMALYENFARETRLPFHRPLSNSSITRLLQNIKYDEIDRFLKTLNTLSIEEEEQDSSNVYYALDSTSISTYSRFLNEADWGHNKDGDNLKQINVLFIVNQKTGCPIYYRYYAGSTPDVSTISCTLKEYARLGINRKAILVADRGYSSIKNINRCYQNDQSFIFNMGLRFNLCKQHIIENLSKLQRLSSYDARIGQSFVTVTSNWSYPMQGNYNTKYPPKDKAKIYIHLYLDHEIRTQAEYEFREKFAEIKEILRDNNEAQLTEEQIEFFKKYMFQDQGTLDVNYEKYFEYMLTKGIRVLVSDCVSDPIEAYRAYQERNEAEVSFSKYKEYAGARRLNVSTDKSLRGKMFVLFLACSILCMLRSKIQACQDRKANLPYDSSVKILRELSSIKQTIFQDGGYFSEVVGKNKRIFDALNIPMPEPEMGVTYEEDDIAAVEG